MSITLQPFDALRDIAARSKKYAEGLPAQEEAVSLWNGIGFKLAGEHYVAPMGEVTEILHMPRYTQIPGVKPWLLGVANVRGRLLPVADLVMYFGLPRTKSAPRDRRVLVVEQDDMLTGFIVDAVMGMQYFSADTFKETSEDVPESMQPFVQGSYTKNEDLWRVLSTIELMEDENFMDVAQW